MTVTEQPIENPTDAAPAQAADSAITFEREPASYRHWKLTFDAPIARLSMQVDPSGGLIGDYELKLNSYDIGVDIELADAVRRIRFEHPEIRCVILDSGIEGIFCAGANIRMLAGATHSHKVNFCKFTNETRLEMEEASANSGLKFLAAINGPCSGGGYEVAMACDHLLLLDDRSSSVSLPEIPLLGVLPGTGGLTRLTDKRHVRRDRADMFATKAEGVQGAEAVAWSLVDEIAPPSTFAEAVMARAHALADTSDRDTAAEPAALQPLGRTISIIDTIPGTGTDANINYRYVTARLDRAGRSVAVNVASGPDDDWTLECARQLDDLLCHLRFNEPLLGTLVITTSGDAAEVLRHDEMLVQSIGHVARETSLLWKRVLSRLDLTARTIIATVEPGSCFVGILAELALAADRTYMLDGVFEDDDQPLPAATMQLSAVSTGPMPMANGLTRLQSRLYGNDELLTAAQSTIGTPLDAQAAVEVGLVTAAPDDLDWHDEVRLAIEERASFSPDALTGMEANHRFCGPETMATKIFSRLSAWQNWIFIRPNASGPDGALRRYGTGSRADFDYHRT